MIIAINYADETYAVTQKFSSKCALKFGADRVVEYSPKDISEEFRSAHSDIFSCSRGAGYWIWKPYIIRDALNKAKEGDYIVYTDSGSAFVNKVNHLIDAMEQQKTDIMVFSLTRLEKCYSKRDAFILMDCDEASFYNTPQRIGGYIIVKKTRHSCEFIEEYLRYASDIRIVSDMENTQGEENYEGFVENRHDQTVLSLLSKKWNLPAFRDPSQFGNNYEEFSEEVIRISPFPQIIESHRRRNLRHFYELEYSSGIVKTLYIGGCKMRNWLSQKKHTITDKR